MYIVGRMKRFLLVDPNGLAYKILPKPIEEAIAEDKVLLKMIHYAIIFIIIANKCRLNVYYSIM